MWCEKVSSSSLFMGYREWFKLRLGWSVIEGSESHAKEGEGLEVTWLISNLSHQFLSTLRSKDFGCVSKSTMFCFQLYCLLFADWVVLVCACPVFSRLLDK